MKKLVPSLLGSLAPVALALAFAGCSSPPEREPLHGEMFEVRVSGLHPGENLAIDVSDASRAPGPVALEDRGTSGGARRFRLGSTTGGPGHATIEGDDRKRLDREGRLELVLEFRGHEDRYVVNRVEGRFGVDPRVGELSRIAISVK